MWFFGIVIVVGLLALFWFARKAFISWYGEEQGATSGFSMGDLRDMRKRGQISEAEFERAKAMVIDSAKRAAAAPPPKAPLKDFQAKGINFTGGFPIEPRDDRHRRE
ncbi:MAG TPA: SHOCT domain-containing protein [Tepidisphaeraceae bacterium]|jgi:hypothetical protein|nr:SHOCT domain-containing protein [Tepidisphaeraceae bacterium]